MAIYSLNHKYIGKKTHPPRVASDHLRYVIRKSACSEVIAANMPTPEIGTRGGKTKAWLEHHEDTARSNGRVIDKIMLALPIELDISQRVELIKEYVTDITGGEETYWLAALHDQESPNPHAHMIFVDKGVHTGKRVIEFSERNSTQRLRERWAAVTNDYFQRHGIDAEIDHRSLSNQREEMMLRAEFALDAAERVAFEKAAENLNRKPSGHDGPELQAYEAKGKTSDKLDRLRDLRKDLSKDAPQQPSPTPTQTCINKLLTELQEPGDHKALSPEDTEVDAWWDQSHGRRAERTGMVTILATLHPKAEMLELQKMVGRLLSQIDTQDDHPLRRYRSSMTTLGQATRNGRWRNVEVLARVVNTHIASRDEAITTARPDVNTAAVELNEEISEVAETNTATSGTQPKFRDLKEIQREERARIAEQRRIENARYEEALRGTPYEEQQTSDSRTPLQAPPAPPAPPAPSQSPSQSPSEARRARQGAMAAEKAPRSAEKAAERAHAKIERPITESRKRVLRGRTAINLAKGTFGNLSAGREALEPYPQGQLRKATDTFLSAASWLTKIWDKYRNGDQRDPEFKRQEKAYIDASAALAEMHLVVPKPKTMTGEDLIDERARLQELEDFPDQGLIAPVMGMIKKRLKQVVAYLTTTDDGQAKAEEVARKQRAEEAEKQRQHDREQRLLQHERKKRAEANRRSTIKTRAAFLEQELTDPDIYDIVVSYGFTKGRPVDEIANDPRWDSLAPGTRTVAWYDLQERVERLKTDRKRREDEKRLAELAATIEDTYDRSHHKTDPRLTKLMDRLQIHKFSDRQKALSDLRWLEPVRDDDQKRPLWEVAKERLDQLDAIAERVQQQAERQKNPKPSSHPNRNDRFEP